MKTVRLWLLIYLAVLVSIAGFFLSWAYLSGNLPFFHSMGTHGVIQSVIQIDSATSGGSTVLVELVFPGENPAIVAVYVTPVNGSPYGEL